MGTHQLHEANQSEILQVLVVILPNQAVKDLITHGHQIRPSSHTTDTYLNEEPEILGAELHYAGHILGVATIRSLGVREGEGDCVDALELQRLGCGVLDDGGEWLEELASKARLLWDERSKQLDHLLRGSPASASTE